MESCNMSVERKQEKLDRPGEGCRLISRRHEAPRINHSYQETGIRVEFTKGKGGSGTESKFQSSMLAFQG